MSRLARGAFWLSFGTAAAKASTLGVSIVTARILGKHTYGEFGIIYQTILMFVAFAGFGLSMMATKSIAEFRRTDPQRAGRVMTLSFAAAFVTGLVMAVSMYVLAPWLAAHTLKAPHLTGILRIGAIALFFSALDGVQIGTLAGFEAFKRIAQVNIVIGLVSLPALALGTHAGGLTGGVWALAAVNAARYLLNRLAAWHEASLHHVRASWRGCLQEWRLLFSFSLPSALSALLMTPVTWTCAAILVSRPEGYSQMAYFSAATRWREAVIFVPFIVGQSVLPILSGFAGEQSNGKYRKVVKYHAFISVVSGVAVALPIAVLAKWIMRSHGEGFEPGAWVLRAVAAGAIVMSVDQVLRQVFVSKGKMWARFMFNLCWAVALLTFGWSAIVRGYGALGLAVAYLLAYLCIIPAQCIYARRFLQQ
jgi:O-antigen/teichoic acid export membrane protein